MNLGVPSLPFAGTEWVFLVLLLAVLIAPVAARRLRLPGLLGLILAGMVIGPHTLGLVVREGFVATIGGAGLLFLMFMAGLELDLRNALQRFRTDTIVFGVATFTIPFVVGIVVLSLMGMDPLPAVLLASTWSTHTVIAYPIFQRYGVVNNRAVAVAVGGTLITNITGLLVLAVVVALHVGGTDVGSWAVMVGGLGLLIVVTLIGLPRLTRWFFSGLGGDRLVQVLYVLTVMFAASALAASVGIEPIVGAFFAGLGLNDHVPKRGVLGERLSFLGNSLLIPMFLISVGMLIDPRSLVSGWGVLALAAGFIAQSQGGKLVAALVVGRWRRFTSDEIGTMFSLTSADAAATLAAVLVGLEVGLFDQPIIEAIVVVILCSCTIATMTGERYAPRIAAPPPDDAAIGRSVVVPIANPHTAGRLTEIGARIASADNGTVYPINVLGPDARRDQVNEHADLLVEAEASALRVGVEASGSVRISDSLSAGVLHQVVERDATAALMGWKGFASAREHMFGGMTDTLVTQLRVPTLLCRLREEGNVQRVVVHVGRTRATVRRSGRFAVAIARRLSASYQVPLVVVGAEAAIQELGDEDGGARRVQVVVDGRTAATALDAHTTDADMVVLGIAPGERIREPAAAATALPDRDLIIAIGQREPDDRSWFRTMTTDERR